MQSNGSNKISLKERLVTTIFGGIPNILLGKKIRNFVYRSLLNRIGKSVNIQHFVELIGTPYIEIGDTHFIIDENAYIGPYVTISGTGNIKIGKNCLIAPHCGIFANNHIFADPTLSIEEQGITGEGIVIEDDCWLGP